MPMFVFQFINYYALMFYLAFVEGNLADGPQDDSIYTGDQKDPGYFLEVTIQLASIIIVKSVIGNIVEIAIPVAKVWLRRRKLAEDTEENPYEQWEQDHDLNVHEHLGLVDEYFEMILQYGLVTMFVPAFPLAPLMALGNNIFEIRIDATKFLVETQRAVPVRVRGIGIFYTLMDFATNAAIVVNGAILAFSCDFIPRIVVQELHGSLDNYWEYVTSTYVFHGINGTGGYTGECRYMGMYSPPWSKRPFQDTEIWWQVWLAKIAFIFVYENMVFVVKALVDHLVPDVPEDVELKHDRERYMQRQLLYRAEFGNTTAEGVAQASSAQRQADMNGDLTKPSNLQTYMEDATSVSSLSNVGSQCEPLPIHVAPAGKVSDFNSLADSYWKTHCLPIEHSHILPVEEACSVATMLAEAFTPCLVLRDFSVTNEKIQLTRTHGLTKFPGKIDRSLIVDYLVLNHNIGVVCICRLPKNVPNPTAFVNPKMKKRMASCQSWLDELSDGKLPMQRWILLQDSTIAIDTDGVSPIGAQVKWAVAAPDFLFQVISDSLTGLSSRDADFEEVAKRFVAMWCNLFIKSSTNHLHPIAGEGNVDSEFLKNKDSFRNESVRFTNATCPKWQHTDSVNTYMLPPIFEGNYTGPFCGKTGDSTGGSRAGGADGVMRGDDGEHRVFESIERFGFAGSHFQLPLVTLHQLRIDAKLRHTLNGLLGLHEDGELDFLCVSAEVGVILIEVKSLGTDTGANRVDHAFRDAVKQLQWFEDLVVKLCGLYGIRMESNVCTKVVAFPFEPLDDLKQKCPSIMERASTKKVKLFCSPFNCDDMFINQSRNALSTWASSLDSLYNTLIPLLVKLHALSRSDGNPASGTIPLSVSQINQTIRNQAVISGKMRTPPGYIRTGKKTGRKHNRDTQLLLALRVYFLTPEQMSAWCGPRHQIIEGCAGTGKTVLLMGKIKEEALAGRKIVVFSKHPTDHLYQNFIVNGGLNGKVRSYAHEHFPNIFPNFCRAVADLVANENLVKSNRSDKSNKLPTTYLAYLDSMLDLWSTSNSIRNELEGMSEACVLIDDALACTADEPLQLKMNLLVDCCFKTTAFSLLWVAHNADTAYTETPKQLSYLGLDIQRGQLHVSRLDTVLRVARNIYETSHRLKLSNLPGNAIHVGNIGHTIVGRTPQSIDISIACPRRNWIRQTCDQIEDTLQTLLYSSGPGPLTLLDVAILVTKLSFFLKEDITSELRSRGFSVTDIKGQLGSAQAGEAAIAVDLPCNSHSFGWAVVIYIYGKPRSNNTERDVRWRSAEKHLARSRCTTALINIRYHLDDPGENSSDEEEQRDDHVKHLCCSVC